MSQKGLTKQQRSASVWPLPLQQSPPTGYRPLMNAAVALSLRLAPPTLAVPSHLVPPPHGCSSSARPPSGPAHFRSPLPLGTSPSLMPLPRSSLFMSCRPRSRVRRCQRREIEAGVGVCVWGGVSVKAGVTTPACERVRARGDARWYETQHNC